MKKPIVTGTPENVQLHYREQEGEKPAIKKRGKAFRVAKWLISPGKPMPNIGQLSRTTIQMRRELKAYKQAQKEKEEKEGRKSFQDYVAEFGLSEADLKRQEKRCRKLSFIYIAITIPIWWLCLFLSQENFIAALVALVVSLIPFSQFAIYKIREHQIINKKI